MAILFPGGKKVNALDQGFTIETGRPENGAGHGSIKTSVAENSAVPVQQVSWRWK